MARRQTVVTADAPQPVGPYSQGISAGGFVFVSGQLPLSPSTGQMVEGDIAEHVRQAIRNVQAVLAAAGCTLADVVKVGVFLADLADAKAANAAYAECFAAARPARTTVGAALPAGAKVEIDAIARIPD